MVLYLVLQGELKFEVMKIASILVLSLILFACGTSEDVIKQTSTTEETGGTVNEESKPQRNVMLKSRIGEFIESDPLTIDSLRLEGNTLFMTVTYSGGCAEHKFQVIGSPAVMKSLPPKRSVQIAHDANGDSCRGMVTRILEIDLTNIAYNPTPGSEIILLFKGSDKSINYIFN